MQQESLRRTLLLLIDGAFDDDEPTLSTNIKYIYNLCPLVFQQYLQISPGERDGLDDKFDVDADILPGTGRYHSIRLWSFMSSKEVEEKFQLAVRLHKLPINDTFGSYIRRAYEIDYEEPFVTSLGTFATKWYRRASFILG